jgi:hypothetical protein
MKRARLKDLATSARGRESSVPPTARVGRESRVQMGVTVQTTGGGGGPGCVAKVGNDVGFGKWDGSVGSGAHGLQGWKRRAAAHMVEEEERRVRKG